jgi:tRNA threonylcarbamoyladenosine biosynthesis protein TsaB
MKNTFPTILSFDTATPMCTVGLRARGEVFLSEEILAQRHAECILPMIEALLQRANISLADLDALAFGCGPGGFIGARIATGVAQGIAFAQDLPVIPVSSLQILAQHAFSKTGARKIAAGWDARMQAIYWGLFEEREGLMQPVQEELLSKPWEIQIASDYLAVGNAWDTYSAELSEHFPARHQTEEFYPNAISLLELGCEKFLKGEFISPLEAEPVYLRDEVATKASR